MAPISHGIVLLLQRFIYITDSFSALVSRDSKSFGWILGEKEKREQGNENRWLQRLRSNRRAIISTDVSNITPKQSSLHSVYKLALKIKNSRTSIKRPPFNTLLPKKAKVKIQQNFPFSFYKILQQNK